MILKTVKRGSWKNDQYNFRDKYVIPMNWKSSNSQKYFAGKLFNNLPLQLRTYTYYKNYLNTLKKWLIDNELFFYSVK